jgi:uncharacterized protein
MLTLEWIELTCPVCELVFETIGVVTRGSDRVESTDAQLSCSAAGLLPYLVHVCHRCGYAADCESFGDDVTIPAGVRARVWAELAPTLAPSVRMPWLLLTAPGSEKHEGAAKVAEWRGERAIAVAELWIRAARCAVDEGDLEADRYYARFAARWFAEALGRTEVAPRDRATIAYGLGELWLRIGDARTAIAWFKRVIDEVIDHIAQRSVVEAARRHARDLDGA